MWGFILIFYLLKKGSVWAGHVARMGEGRGVHRVLVGKPEGKRPLGRPRRRWEDNIKMDLQEVGGGCEEELAQDTDRWQALVSTVMNLRVPKMRGISWLVAEQVSFSRRTLLHGVSKERKCITTLLHYLKNAAWKMFICHLSEVEELYFLSNKLDLREFLFII